MFREKILELFFNASSLYPLEIEQGHFAQLFNFQWIQGRLYSIAFVNEITTHCCWGEEFTAVDAGAPQSSRVRSIFCAGACAFVWHGHMHEKTEHWRNSPKT